MPFFATDEFFLYAYGIYLKYWNFHLFHLFIFVTQIKNFTTLFWNQTYQTKLLKMQEHKNNLHFSCWLFSREAVWKPESGRVRPANVEVVGRLRNGLFQGGLYVCYFSFLYHWILELYCPCPWCCCPPWPPPCPFCTSLFSSSSAFSSAIKSSIWFS